MKTMLRCLVLIVFIGIFMFFSNAFAQVKIENSIIIFPEQSMKSVAINLSKLKFSFPSNSPKEIMAMKGKLFFGKDISSSCYIVPLGYDSNTKEINLLTAWETGPDGKPFNAFLNGPFNPEGTILRAVITVNRRGSVEYTLNFLKNGKFRIRTNLGADSEFTPVAEFSVPDTLNKPATLNKNVLIAEFLGKTLSFEKWSSNRGIIIYVNDKEFVTVNNQKLSWTVDDDGNFCVGMKEKEEGKKGFWGCKTIKKLADGTFYNEGSSPETSGKIFMK
jgi:hypothetical protein